MQVNLPIQVFLAPQKDHMRKPEKGMWDYFCAHCNGDVKPGTFISRTTGKSICGCVHCHGPVKSRFMLIIKQAVVAYSCALIIN